MRVLPLNRKRFIHLKGLTGFDAAAAKNALIGVVPVARNCLVDFVALGFERDVLVLESYEVRRVMNGALAIVASTVRAVEGGMAENAVVSLALRGIGALEPCIEHETVGDGDGAGSRKVTADLDHGGVG